jgi:Fe2+ transport system protein B
MTFNFGSVAGGSGEIGAPVAGRSSAANGASAVRSEPSPERIPQAEEKARPSRRALLVGHPNVGKSVVFGALTGTYVTVSNYPGTTVEITRGHARFGGEVWEIIDTPGTHNLVPMSEDEAVTRDILVSNPHDALVQVGDAKNLVRTLLLSLQLAELGIPFCLDLNMLDEARARGLSIDLEALERELGGVRVNASTATEGEGLNVVRQYLATHTIDEQPADISRGPLPCAPRFPDDIEAAITEVAARLEGPLPVCGRAIATMLLGGERGVGGGLAAVAHVGAEAIRIANDRARVIARTHGVPVFALLSRLRLARAQAIARSVQRRSTAAQSRSHGGHVGWAQSAAVGAIAAAIAALVYDGALRLTHAPSTNDPLASFGFFDIVSRLFSRGLFAGWSPPALVLLCAAWAVGTVLLRRHARVRTGTWKLVASFAAGWCVFWGASIAEGLARGVHSSVPVHLGAAAGLLALGIATLAGDGRDAAFSHAVGRAATHPLWGLPILALVLLLAYKVVGVFGAGTAVDFVERRVFGSTLAETSLDTPGPLTQDFAADGTERLAVSREGPSRLRVVAQSKHGGVYAIDSAARIDVYPGSLETAPAEDGGGIIVRAAPTDLHGARARVWSGYLNRWTYGLFAWIGVPLLTAFVVGPYGLVTMGVTYAVAIVLPVVTTFFFVFSMLEDSGYLPRLAVMSNRVLRGMGLNGKAVLPMVLGLGCDTMATLTARIMETRKERMLVTLLLALGIPCSSQLSVIFALMQRTSHAATLVWLSVVIGTLLGVGFVAARVLPGDTSDFLLEMPPIRQPMVKNIVAKTMARIEWYLKEAVPLFLAGTALLFVLDAAHLLVFVHRAGEPIVHHVLGFSSAGGVSDRVSEALLVGFLRRDFGAAGLLDLARAGRLSPADVAVSMVTITLFIPCIANVFMIAKERGWKVAGMMSGFIFPYAVAIGAVVRLGFRFFGGS